MNPNNPNNYCDTVTRVSVLCANKASVYRGMEGVEVYDFYRDAWSFTGDTPIVAHPPCRAWSIYLKHLAKPEPNEKELGLWCCEQLRTCGGVLEQPAFSELFSVAGFSTPGGRTNDDIWTMEVWQAWWGHRVKKATWLAFCGIPRNAIDTPLRLHPRGCDRQTFGMMSKNQRSATPKAFADWLVSAARLARKAKS